MNQKKVLMPLGTALWLKTHTKLTPKQIYEFCGIDLAKLSAIDDTNTYIQNPIQIGQLTLAEIERCEKDSSSSLKNTLDLGFNVLKKKKVYFSEYQKSQRPSIIAWFCYYYPKISCKAIAKLLQTKQPYIEKIAAQIKENPDKISIYSPVKFQFCTETDLDRFIKENNIDEISSN